jgi:FixJ family two-component response regulator
LAKALLVSIVDDDVSVRTATADLLESHGYMTAAFASAEELLQSERLQDTHCVITDVRMPGLSGVDLQRRLADTGLGIPVIFITAYSEEHIRRAALAGGASGFFTKPVSEIGLIHCVEKALHDRGAAVER